MIPCHYDINVMPLKRCVCSVRRRGRGRGEPRRGSSPRRIVWPDMACACAAATTTVIVVATIAVTVILLFARSPLVPRSFFAALHPTDAPASLRTTIRPAAKRHPNTIFSSASPFPSSSPSPCASSTANPGRRRRVEVTRMFGGKMARGPRVHRLMENSGEREGGGGGKRGSTRVIEDREIIVSGIPRCSPLVEIIIVEFMIL